MPSFMDFLNSVPAVQGLKKYDEYIDAPIRRGMQEMVQEPDPYKGHAGLVGGRVQSGLMGMLDQYTDPKEVPGWTETAEMYGFSPMSFREAAAKSGQPMEMYPDFSPAQIAGVGGQAVMDPTNLLPPLKFMGGAAGLMAGKKAMNLGRTGLMKALGKKVHRIPVMGEGTNLTNIPKTMTSKKAPLGLTEPPVGGIIDEGGFSDALRTEIPRHTTADGAEVTSISPNVESRTRQSYSRDQYNQLDQQSIVSLGDAEKWMKDRGLFAPHLEKSLPRAQQITPSETMKPIFDNPDFWELSPFDRAKVMGRAERGFREQMYLPTGSVGSGNLKTKELSESASTITGRRIRDTDTVKGCNNNCINCYALGGANQNQVTFHIPVEAKISGTINKGEILRTGVKGDPSINWRHSNEQIKGVFDRSNAKKQGVTPQKNSFAITKLQDVDGYDPNYFPNLEVSIDPVTPEHLIRSFENIRHIKKLHGDKANIVVRIRSFESLNPEMQASLDFATKKANDLDLHVLETRLRWKNKKVAEALEMDPEAYKQVGSQLKLKKPVLKGKAKKHHLCDAAGTGKCSNCRTCEHIMLKTAEEFKPPEPLGLGKKVYHGSPYKFDKYNLENLGKETGHPSASLGPFFSSEKTAKSFVPEGKGYLMAGNMDFKKPKQIRADDFQEMMFGENKNIEKASELKAEIEDIAGMELEFEDNVLMKFNENNGRYEPLEYKDLTEDGVKKYETMSELLSKDRREMTGLTKEEWANLRTDFKKQGYDGIIVKGDEFSGGENNITQIEELYDDTYIPLSDNSFRIEDSQGLGKR